MTTINDYISKLGADGENVIGYAIIGSMVNILIEAAEEIEDEDIQTHLSAILKIVSDKQTAIMSREVFE